MKFARNIWYAKYKAARALTRIARSFKKTNNVSSLFPELAASLFQSIMMQLWKALISAGVIIPSQKPTRELLL